MNDNDKPVRSAYRSKNPPVATFQHPVTGAKLLGVAGEFLLVGTTPDNAEMSVALIPQDGIPICIFIPMDKPTAKRFLEDMRACAESLVEPAKHDEPVGDAPNL